MATIYTDITKLPKRSKNDFYPTPMGFASAALRWLNLTWPPNRILDPGCGTGVWGRALTDLLTTDYPPNYMVGVDIAAEQPGAPYTEYHQTDYRMYLPDKRFDLIIGNPPFDQAEAFILHSLDLLLTNGHLMFLLPLNFLEGMKRGRELFKLHPPVKVGIVSRRISYSGNGKTNAQAHCLIHWRKDFQGLTALNWMTFEYAAEDKAQVATMPPEPDVVGAWQRTLDRAQGADHEAE